MRYARSVLFYSVIAIFVATAVVTLLGVVGRIAINDRYLNVLFTALIIELVAAVIGLFRTTNWFGTSRASGAEEQLVGVWWQLLRHGGDNALGLIKISYAEQEQQIKLDGSAFTAEGAVHARFWSSAVALNAAKLHLHYFWQGDENQSDENFSGVGYIRFTRSAEDRQVDRGTGWFTTGDIDRANVTDKKKVEFRRASAEESHVMSSTDRQAIQRLVSSVYSRWASRSGKTTTQPGLTG